MYKSTLTSNQGPYQHNTYHGITETKFKQRYANYVKSFRNERIKAKLNFWMNYGASNCTPNVVWGILKKHQQYNLNTKQWYLCLNEKLEILKYKGHNLLNKRSKITNHCPHWSKFPLALYDTKNRIKSSVAAFEQPCIGSHSFPKSDSFTSYVKSTR